MRVCSTASGGAMYIPEDLERKDDAQSYQDLAEEKPKKKKRFSLFGLRKQADEQLQEAA